MRNKQHYFIFLFLFLFCLFFRLPFFFPLVINWDESAFILLGQSLLDGNLPYTELWDLKPPLTFVFFATVIALVGKNIALIRLTCAILITITAFLVFLLGQRLHNKQAGILSAIIVLLMSSLLPSGQAVLTEHIALLPLITAIYLLITKNPSPFNYFLTGLFIAVACFIRLNLAYVAIFLGAFIFITEFSNGQKNNLDAIKSLSYYCLGGTVLLLLVIAPYAATDNLPLLYSSLITAPLNYANCNHSSFGALKIHSQLIFQSITAGNIYYIGVNLITWIGGFVGLAVALVHFKKATPEEKHSIAILLTAFVGVVVSILNGGAAFGHYLIQLVPFLSLFIVILSKYCFTKTSQLLFLLLFIFSTSVAVIPILDEYKKATVHAKKHKTLISGGAFEVAKYIKHHNKNHEPIFVMTDPIIYWLTNQKPLSK